MLVAACDFSPWSADHSGAHAAGGPFFEDVAARVGLTYRQSSEGTRFGCDGPARQCAVRAIHMTGGAAAGDFDGDGWIDLYVTRLEAPGILYRNVDGTHFEDVTEQQGLGFGPGSNGAGWGDVDNDGDLDLYVTSILDARHYLFINEGDGFVEQGLERGAAIPTEHVHQGFSVAFGDYDLDGYLDIHTTEWLCDLPVEEQAKRPSHARLLRNRGAQQPGYFEDVTQEAGVDMLAGPRPSRFSFASTFADMDQDGWPDLLVASDFGTSRLFWNQGDGRFVDGTEAAGVGGDENGMGLAVGDVNSDGLPDWFISSIYDPEDACAAGGTCGWGTTGNRLYINNGGRTFSDSTTLWGVEDGGWGWGCAFIDFDNDADLDLVMTNGMDYPLREALPFHSDPLRLWHNGQGAMMERAAELGLASKADGKGVLVFDWNADGDLDLFVVNHEGTPHLFDNLRGLERDFLRVQLTGTRSNPSGIGAWVTVQAREGGPLVTRGIHAGSHFLGQSEAVAHFGLGGPDEEPVHRVEVRWPSGVRTDLADVPRNQTLRLGEP